MASNYILVFVFVVKGRWEMGTFQMRKGSQDGQSAASLLFAVGLNEV